MHATIAGKKPAFPALAFFYGCAHLPERRAPSSMEFLTCPYLNVTTSHHDIGFSFTKVRRHLGFLFRTAQLEHEARITRLNSPHGIAALKALRRTNNHLSTELLHESYRWLNTLRQEERNLFAPGFRTTGALTSFSLLLNNRLPLTLDYDQQKILNQKLTGHLVSPEISKIVEVLAFVRTMIQKLDPFQITLKDNIFVPNAPYNFPYAGFSGNEQKKDPLSTALLYTLKAFSVRQTPLLVKCINPAPG